MPTTVPAAAQAAVVRGLLGVRDGATRRALAAPLDSPEQEWAQRVRVRTLVQLAGAAERLADLVET